MTQVAIQKQIEVIKKINANARLSSETATKYLIDAGIIKEKPEPKPETKKKK